jgi:hypothetical protein
MTNGAPTLAQHQPPPLPPPTAEYAMFVIKIRKKN